MPREKRKAPSACCAAVFRLRKLTYAPCVASGMNSFDYLFSFYGLLLGIALANVAIGFADMWRDFEKIRVGTCPPLLCGIVMLGGMNVWLTMWHIRQDVARHRLADACGCQCGHAVCLRQPRDVSGPRKAARDFTRRPLSQAPHFNLGRHDRSARRLRGLQGLARPGARYRLGRNLARSSDRHALDTGGTRQSYGATDRTRCVSAQWNSSACSAETIGTGQQRLELRHGGPVE